MEVIDKILEYVSLGYEVFPCLPMQKLPAVPFGVHDGTRDIDQIHKWFREKPKANWGIVCDGLIVIDCDTGNDWHGTAKLIDLANCPTQVSPGGIHFIYRRPEGHNWRNTSCVVAPKIDTKTDAGYFLAEPSIRSKGAYEFDRPLLPIDELPYPPDWLVKELDVAMSRPEVVVPSTRPHIDDVGDVFERAIRYIDACPEAVSGQGGHSQTFSVTTALVHGFCLEEGQALQVLSDYYNPRCQPPWSEAELRHKVKSSLENPPSKQRGWLLESVSKTSPDVDITALVQKADEVKAISATTIQPNDDDDEPAVDLTPGDPGPFPSHLLDVPGFINEMSDLINETNYTEQPILSLAGALTFQGFLAGRRVCEPSGARTNVNVLGVAETCCGKERARSVCKEILATLGKESMFFERPASYQGVQKRVARSPQSLLLWDEMGQSLQTYRNPNVSPHLRGILRTITEFYTSAHTIYCSDSHADDRNDFTINQPCLVVYGTSTPDELFAGLTLESIKNGFCGRMALFEGHNSPEDVEVDCMALLPERLIRAADRWLTFIPPGNDLNMVNPNPVVVPRTGEANEIFRQLRKRQSEARKHPDSIHRALWGRSVQKAAQMALVYACSKYGPNIDELKIDAYAAQWASEIVAYTNSRLAYLATIWIADDDFHARQNEVLRYVKENDGAVRRNDLTRKFQRWSVRVRDEVITNLIATGQLALGPGPKTGRGTWFILK